MNIGAGEIIVLHQKGWSCSREALLELEFDMVPGGAKKTIVASVKSLYNASGELIPREIVECVFRYDSGIKVAFKAVAIKDVRLEVIGEINNDFETILNKISQWQEQFKEN